MPSFLGFDIGTVTPNVTGTVAPIVTAGDTVEDDVSVDSGISDASTPIRGATATLSASSHSTPDQDTSTQFTDEDTMTFVLVTILGIPIGSVTHRALAHCGVNSMHDLLMLDGSDIGIVETDTGEQPSLMDRVKLKLLNDFSDYLLINTSETQVENWMWARVVKKQWLDFSKSRKKPTAMTIPSSPASTVQETVAYQKSEAAGFAYGIKKNISDYPILKEARFWNSWKTDVENLATLHECSEVLQANYAPETDDKKRLFELQKTFMYSVLLTKIEHTDAKNIVRSSRDSQLVYQQLVHRFEGSPEANIDAQQLRQKIYDMKLDSNWKSGPTKFLQLWEKDINTLDSIVPNSLSLWSEDARMLQLTGAIGHHTELSKIIADDRMDIHKGKAPLTYDQYRALLRSRAYEIDNRTRTAGNGNRSVNTSRRGTRRANAAQREFIPKEKWNAMTHEERMAVLKKKKAVGSTGTNSSSTATNRRKANQAESTSPTTPTETGSAGTFTVPHQSPSPITVAAAGVLNAATNGNVTQTNVIPDLRTVMSSIQGRGATIGTTGTFTVGPEGTTFHVNVAHTYRASFGERDSTRGALVDGGANGGMAGADMRVLATHDSNTVQVVGIAGNCLHDLPLVTAAAVIMTTDGPVVGVFHQYAHHPEGKTIHAVPQLDAYDVLVDCRSRKKGGLQRVTTPDGWVVPLHVRSGLAYIDMRPPTDAELLKLPHVAFTSDVEWDPTILDDETNLEIFNENLAYDVDDDSDLETLLERRERWSRNDAQGQRVVAATLLSIYESAADEGTAGTLDLEDTVDLILCDTVYEENRATVVNQVPDYEKVRPCLGYAPVDVIKLTFKNTTQFARNTVRLPFRNHVKSRFPALNVRRRNEPVATDTIWADTPAIGSGATAAQVFVGRHTYVTDVYGCKTDGEFAGLLEENIRQRGAMDCLISDSAKAVVNKKVHDILRMYHCRDYQSEAENQQQNFAENRIGTLKNWTNTVMDRGGAPGYTWLLCVEYVAELLNHLANKNLNGLTPLAKLNGVTPDISVFLGFYFYQPVLYAVDNGWPSETREASGRWVGVAKNVGDALTYKILTDDTQQIIFRSAVRPRDGVNDNLRVTLASPEEPIGTGRTVVSSKEYALPDVRAHTFEPDDLVGRTYLGLEAEDGSRFRMRIAEKIAGAENDKESLKFLVKRSDGEIEELLSYNELMDIVSDQYEQEQNDPNRLWTFKAIVGHEGPLSKRHPSYKGSRYNVLVQWEDGSTTYEPLDIIGADDPVVCAQYAKDNNLLHEPGWKRFRRLVKNAKVFKRMMNQTKLKSLRRAPVYKYGFEVPRSYKHAMELDAANGNTRWGDACNLELDQIIVEYVTFKSVGFRVPIPKGYKQIRCHFVFDVKHDGRHKARYVAGGHMTDPPLDSVYSGVVTLRSLRLVIFLAELNGLELYAADVGNAYLEAFTKEKIVIIGGPEFAAFGLEGHTLLILRALYGLKTSGARWHERFADTLRSEGFTPCKADPDVWMRQLKDKYEYIAVYVDDLAMAMEDPESFCDILRTKHNYKLKGDGPLKYHLGCDFGRDPDGTYSYGPIKYVDKMLESYERMFNGKPKGVRSPLEKGDHPELDETRECTDEERGLYMSMIGQCQWLISLGRFDIATAIMTLSRFRAAPREGHLTRLKRVYGYLREYPNGSIRVQTALPENLQCLEKPKVNWTSVYGNVKEELPYDMPEPLGKPVITTTYVDANLYHDYLSGRSVTGAIHLVNQTPVEWYCKRQATVETATYGSEFNAARTATEQIMDLRYTLRMLGVPLLESYMMGDNQSVVTNSTVPHSQLNKRHNALAYHRVREAIASGVLTFFHIDGKTNPADILSKHCGYTEAWPHIKTLLFWRGRADESG